MSDFWDKEPEVLVDRIDKTGTKSTFYMIKRVFKNGRELIDFREHYHTKDGALRYGKGTSIPIENVQEIADHLQEIANANR